MTLVVDASVVAEVLAGTERGLAAAPVLDDHQLIAPQLLAAEIASIVRGWSLGGHLDEPEALRVFHEFRELGVDQIDMVPLLPAAWALRHNVTAYDAMYVALARAAQCRLLTLDERLAKATPDCAVLP